MTLRLWTLDNGNDMEKSLYQLKKDELDYFSHLLDLTKSFINRNDSCDLEAVMNFIELRDQKIEEIKSLKAEQHRIKENMGKVDRDYLCDEIAEIVQSLVALGGKVLDILQTRKMETTKEMTNIADNHSRRKKMQIFQNEKQKRIDIYQR